MRLLGLIIMTLLVLSIIPFTSFPIVKATVTQQVHLGAYKRKALAVAENAHSSIIVWSSDIDDAAYYAINSTTSIANIIGPTKLFKATNVTEVAVASNGTAYFIAVANQTDNQYDVIGYIIDASSGALLKGPIIIANTSDSEREQSVIWGGGYWLVVFEDRNKNSVNMTFVDAYGNIVGDYGVPGMNDYVTPRVTYNPNVNKFLVVYGDNNTNRQYDIVAWILSPGDVNPDDIIRVNVTNDAVDDYKYTSQGAVPTYYGDWFVIFWADSSPVIKFANISATGEVHVVDTGVSPGSNGIYPDASTGSAGAVFVWKDSSDYHSYSKGTIKVSVIRNNNMDTYVVTDTGYYPQIAPAAVQNEFIVLYGDGSGHVVGQRFNATSGNVGEASIIATNSTDNDVQFESLVVDNTTGKAFYAYGVYTGDGTPLLWGSFDRNDLPPATLISTSIVNVKVETKDDNGDGFFEAGETVYISGKLVDKDGFGIPGQSITATLFNYYAYVTGSSNYNINVTAVTNTTQSDGSFLIKITVPSTALSGLYWVKIVYNGKTGEYTGSSWEQPHDYYFMVYHPAPSLPSWATIPADIGNGPALYYTSGQAIIVDPSGDEVNYTYGNIPVAEAGQLDAKAVWLYTDNNYLYIKVEYNGNPGKEGEIAPVFLLALDFTPKNANDGYDAGYSNNIPLFYPWTRIRYADGHLEGKRGWDLGITLTPVHSNSRVVNVSNGNTVFGPLLMIYNRTNGHIIETAAGYINFGSNYVEAAVPLDLVRWGNPELPTTGIKPVLAFAAVFAVNVTSSRLGYLIDFDNPSTSGDDLNVADFIGSYPANFTGTHLDQGIKESYSGKAIDTKFILNIDFDNQKFFGYTETYITATNITTTGFGEQRYDGPRSFVGTVKYIARLRDANNTDYYVYGKTVHLYVNGTDASSATSDAIGIAAITYTWHSSDWKHNHTIYVKFDGDDYYMGSESTNYTVRTLYLINITKLNYTWIDRDRDGFVSRGDSFIITANVKAWDGTAWVTAPDGILVKFIIHSPDVVLGTAPTQGGVSTLNYTFTGNEQLLGSHVLEAAGDGATSWTPTYPGASINVPQTFAVLPAPEPPILPILLLAAILLFIIIKKRK